MKKLILLIATCLLVISGNLLIFAKEDSSSSAWQQAVAIASLNKNLTPGFIKTRTEELNNKAQVTSFEEVQTKVFQNEKGEVDSEIIKAVLNGKDITDKRKKEAKEAKEKQQKKDSKDGEQVSTNPFDCNPFDPELQKEVSIKQIESKILNNVKCSGYEFTLKKKSGTSKGTVWLEEKTSIPVKMQFSTIPLPKYVSKMVTVVDYEYSTKGFWYPKEIKIEGTGGFLNIKKTIRVNMNLSDFWVYHKK